jgi:hypothetical protein
MADQQQHPPTQDPPIYKFLSPKTQGILRATAAQREEAARLNDDTMSNEQTYVNIFETIRVAVRLIIILQLHCNQA